MLFVFNQGLVPLGTVCLHSNTDQNLVQGGMVGVWAEDLDTTDVNFPLSDGYDEYTGGGAKNVKPALALPSATLVDDLTALGVNTMDVDPTLRKGALLHDGDRGYGTLFGHMFGGATANKYYHSWNAGDRVGPNTIAGSGKVTAYIKQGMYGTDQWGGALDPATPLIPGSPLFVGGTGLLEDSASGAAGTGAPSTAVAYFVGFVSDPSFVSTSIDTVGGDTATPIMLFVWTA